MSTLYDLFKQQGKTLPSTVEGRFADPQFAAAARQAGITQDQYRINQGNAAMNTRIASLFGRQPTQQPQQQPQQQTQPIQQTQNTQQNTMVNTPVGELFSYTPQQFNNPELDQFYSQYRQDAMQTIDEDAIKQQKLQQVQANIDALRQVYAQKLRETQRQGQNRLGQSAAIQARSGMLGSDFGAAQTSEIGQFNADIENSVRMEEQAAIEALKAQAEDRASQAIREKRAAKEAGAEKYIEYLKTSTQRKEEGKRNLVQDLLLKGIDPRRLDSGSLQSILNGYGITQDALFSLYDTEKIKSDQASAQARAEAEAKARRENIELGKIEMETKLMRDKFEEDKRRFGLEYALKQQDLGLRRQAMNQRGSGAATGAAVGDPSQTTSQLDFVDTVLNRAEALKGASGASAISRFAGDTFLGDSNFRRLENTIDSIKTNVLTMMGDPNVRKFFGPQMTNEDVKRMMAGGTTLDPIANNPQEVQEEITRIRDLVRRARQAVQVGLQQEAQGALPPQNVNLSNFTDEELQAIANQ